VGGSKTIAEALGRTIRAAGGEIRTRAGVQEVIVEKGRAVGVRLENGEEIRARHVVSSIGAVATGQKLLPESAPPKARAWSDELKGLEQSPAYLDLYLGFEGDIQAAGATVSNQWHYEDWDMERDLWHFEDPKAEPPFLFVSFPSLKDPHHDPGPTLKHTGEMIVFVDWKHFDAWKHTRRGKREPEYHAFKKTLEERLLAAFRAKFPRLAPLLKFAELSTPLSTSFFIRAPRGAIYGLAPTPARHATPALRTRTPLPGLYLSGCDVAALGVAGALTGGILTAGTLDPRILRRLV
jgi:all-trans-retinol 13,14-reductase